MLVIAGETIVDMIEGEAGQFSAFTGGGPYNVARAAARMGVPTGYLNPISRDSFGDMFDAEMRDLNITQLSPKSNGNTGLAIVQKDKNGGASYTFHREAAADRDINLPAIRVAIRAAMPKTGAFYVGGLAIASGKEAQIWADFVGEITCPVFVDPNIRPSFITDRTGFLKRLAQIYDATDIVKLSDEDCAWLSPDESPESYLQSIMKTHKIGLGFLTRGAEGATAFCHGKPACHAPPIPVIVRDTVGAGDCFSAGILATMLRYDGLADFAKNGLQTALDYASKAAAITCTRDGASAPSHAEIIAFKG